MPTEDGKSQVNGAGIGRWILYGLGAAFAVLTGLLAYAVFGSSGKAGSDYDSGLSQQSRSDLASLPFCAVSRKYGVPVDVLAGVVLAERQLHRTFSDDLQEELFKVMLWIFGDGWWDKWAKHSLELASWNEGERHRATDWSPLVKATGIIFSIGPAQITPKTALTACAEIGHDIPLCAGSTKSLIEDMVSPEKSLEVAAIVLKAEQQNQVRLTGIDVTGSPGKWAMLYNFGGDIFRALFADDLDRGPNAFGRWVDRNAAEIRALSSCSA